MRENSTWTPVDVVSTAMPRRTLSGATDLTKEPEFPHARFYAGRTSIGTIRAAGFDIELAFVM